MDSNLHDRNGGVGRGGCRGHRGARWADTLLARSRVEKPTGEKSPEPSWPVPSPTPVPSLLPAIATPNPRPVGPEPLPQAVSLPHPPAILLGVWRPLCCVPGLSTGPDTWLVPPTQADEALGGPVWSPAVPTPAWGTRRRSPAKRVHPRGIGHPVLPPHPRPAAVPSATACLSTLRFPPSQGTTVQSGGSSAQRHPAGPVAAPHLTDCGDSGWPRICPSVSLAGELGGRSLAG